MAADLRVVALGWSQDHVERFFDGIEAGRQRLAELLHAIRTERLVCGHLAGELQGEDGGTRWCAGCEREAGIRTETEARVVEAAVQEVKYVLDEDLMDHARLVRRIRTLAPADYVALRREDFEEMVGILDGWAKLPRLIGEQETCFYRWVLLQDRIRTALSRAGKGE